MKEIFMIWSTQRRLSMIGTYIAPFDTIFRLRTPVPSLIESLLDGTPPTLSARRPVERQYCNV